jgi:putative N6-adenine-specific DNA methylase
MAETLAAAVILETGYDGTQPLVNPMCGSGTLAIEAALIATGRPPGLLRSNFGFKHLLGFDDAAWQAIRAEARKVRKPNSPAPIVATDIDDRAIRASEQNARTAGVDHLIAFTVCDFNDTPMPDGKGIVVLNPEYGERMGQERELETVYARIGDFFKQKCPGWTGYVFTGNPNLAKRVGLKAARRIPLFNANIECRLLKYDLYEGTRRKPRE